MLKPIRKTIVNNTDQGVFFIKNQTIRCIIILFFQTNNTVRWYNLIVMEMNEMPSTTPVPGVLKTLGEGCNLVANNVKLMLIPLAADLFLLFGPKLRIREYFQPYLSAIFSQMLSTVSKSLTAQLEPGIGLITDYVSSINLFGFIRTVPIGVITLFSSGSAKTPLGSSAEIELHSILYILPVIFLMIVSGIIIGTLYFYIIARSISANRERFTANIFGKQLLNTILLYIALVIVLFITLVPGSCMMTAALMTSPVIYQIIMLLIMIFVCWLVIPLFYIPHGIFVKQLDLPAAIKNSFQMATWSGMMTVRFILFSIIISMGLNLIWSIPEQSSWLILFSIFGHAYVSTALLTGSFIFYRELDQWQNENRAFLEWRKANLRITQLRKRNL